LNRVREFYVPWKSPAALCRVMLFCLLAGLPAPLIANDPAGIEFFEKKIRPLLAAQCFDCHHPENKIKGGLRLDSREGWMAGGELGPVIVPGRPEESLLIKAVRYGEPKLQMPPKRRLSDAQIADLEAWVKMGAPDPRTGPALTGVRKGIDLEAGRQFWSFRPIAHPQPPAVKDAAWPRTDIDRFILARLEQAGLRPGADAEPEALIRRLTFTLTGLPPTPEEVAAFVTAFDQNDPSNPSDPCSALVDRLLASPHYGERWGRHWLDVARFAESSGGGRTLLFKDAWRYRDYVIESFNADVPFDQFIREQIAGDLLSATNSAQRRRQLTATAFLALGPTNYEEQDKKQLKFDIIDEQLDTLGKTLLGMTLGCARCHDHKFDPVPTRDYYALAGIFASTRTLFNYTDNVARWVDTPLPLDGEQEETLRRHEQQVTELKQRLDAARAEAARLASARPAPENHQPGKPIPITALPGIVVDDAEAKAVGQWKHSTFSRSYIGDGYLHDLNEDKGAKTLTFVPRIPRTGRYEVRLAYPAYPSRANRVPVTVFHADGEHELFVDMTAPPPIGGRFVSLGTYRFEKDGAGYVLISNEGTRGYVNVDALQFLPEGEANGLELTAAPADRENNAAARAAAKHVRELEAELKSLQAAVPQRPVTMSVREEDEIGDTEIRVRGLVHNLGPKVPRGFLQVATTGPAPEFSPKESGRRELAEWIVSPDNPLTTRVLVNRVWHWLFGTGLVRTTDNFGTTGEAPSHPELLDYLARRFQQEGWSVKQLVREIVLSRTWQLAVGPPPATDPDNRLLSRHPRRRLDAEQIRDAILFVSGRLDLTVGGPNIKGAGVIDANTTAAQNTEYTYVFDDVRRSVYTPAFRARRLELFEAFDFANINQPLGERNVSTVAPQALYLLNNPFVIEQARAAAQRALAEDAPGDDARLERACRRALGRAPLPAERETFLRFLRENGGDSQDEERRLEAWAHVFQTLFASLDFRHLN
jgi:mono/diheme cytochrome c family protein